VRYFATASGPRVRERMTGGVLGQIVTPAAGNAVTPGVVWCADNGVFGGTYPGDDAYLAWLAARAHLAGSCAFAVAPDVVCDAAATLTRSRPMFARIRALGYPVALVAQNGLEHLTVPWGDFDVLFIGGDDAWKESGGARGLVCEAKEQGKRVHMGRVNSLRRLRYAQRIGCDSVDGTYLAFGPHANLPTLLHWLRVLKWDAAQGTLFDME
jgi:hypothetical protein